MAVIPTRDQWKAFRDRNKIPQGAGKISIGDALDKIQKSLASIKRADDLKNAERPIETLIRGLESYKESIRRKYPNFVPEVDKFLGKPLAETLFNLRQFKNNVSIFQQHARMIPDIISKYRAAADKGDVPAYARAIKEVIYLLATIVKYANMCADLDPERKQLWQNVAKYAGTGDPHAKSMLETIAQYSKTQPGSQDRTKLYARWKAQCTEAIDLLNKISATASPFMGG
jgi:hypothetical protein